MKTHCDNNSHQRRLPATRQELEAQLLQAVESLDAGKGADGEEVFRRLRQRIENARGIS